MGFERVTSVRPSVRPFVRKRLGFGALDGVRAPSPRLLYSVGDCSMIQLNDSETLVSVQQVFSTRNRPASQNKGVDRNEVRGLLVRLIGFYSVTKTF